MSSRYYSVVMVKDITEDGYIRFAPLGGWLDQTLLGHIVSVKTRKGPLAGVIGCTPPHMMPREERDKVIKRKKMFIDIGARDKRHAQNGLGVRIGDPIVPQQKFQPVGDGKHLLAKAWDKLLFATDCPCLDGHGANWPEGCFGRRSVPVIERLSPSDEAVAAVLHNNAARLFDRPLV